VNTVENTSFVWMIYVNFLLRCHAETGLSEVTLIIRHELSLDRPVSASSSSDYMSHIFQVHLVGTLNEITESITWYDVI
jgi:hypothetical protein